MPRANAPLRWIGGKQRLAESLIRYYADVDFGSARYFEPFLGGGAVFFNLRPVRSTIGDLNPDLVLFYQYLRDFPAELRAEAQRLDCLGTAESYAAARSEFNSGAQGLRRAALFLFLNRTGFNGIWRVNRFGQYTVPFGYRRLSLIAEAHWNSISGVLQGADLVCGDYEVTMADAWEGDVVFLDPPYFDSSGRELFSRYTLNGFTLVDHRRLREQVELLDTRGVLFLLTVRADPVIRDLYADYKIDVLAVRSSVGARGGHSPADDLVIRNFA